jgi:hypothetical protein
MNYVCFHWEEVAYIERMVSCVKQFRMEEDPTNKACNSSQAHLARLTKPRSTSELLIQLPSPEMKLVSTHKVQIKN